MSQTIDFLSKYLNPKDDNKDEIKDGSLSEFS